MRADILVCTAADHDQPVYTLSDRCPVCGEPATNSAPAPFSPTDPHGKYRRALKRSGRNERV
jgi:H/ACA ribonucleoprotein complex subunit 3